MKEAIDLDDLSDNDRHDPPPVIDPVRLRRLLILLVLSTDMSKHFALHNEVRETDSKPWWGLGRNRV